MLCKEIIKIIESTYPRKYALEWDNVGLLVGRDDKEVKHIYVALDATDEVIQRAADSGADMLITHHPLIFSGMKKINNQDFIGSRVLRLIQNDISYYAMHTNYDVMGMASLSGEKMSFENAEVLEVTREEECPEGIGRVADVSEMTLRECCELVKNRFGLDTVKVFGDLEGRVERIAISPGSGKSMVHAALEKKADVLVTGDIDHHTGIDAVAQGLFIIDAGHYGIEHIFIEDMARYLERMTDEVEIEKAQIVHPFCVI